MAGARPHVQGSVSSTDRDWLEDLAKEFSLSHRAAILGEWRMLMGRSTRGPYPWQARLNRLLSSPGLLDRIRGAHRTARGGPRARTLEVLERLATDVAIEQHRPIARTRARLQRRIVAFRPSWKGRKVNRATVEGILRSREDRSDREAAWSAQHPLEGSLEEEVRGLVRARNQRARELGFRSFPEYRIAFEGFTLGKLQELLEGLARYSREADRRRREQFEDATGLRDFYPWDEAFTDELVQKSPPSAFGRGEMVASVLAGTRQWGFGPAALRFRIDQHDLPMGGISIPVEPPGDVRVIVHPSTGWERYMILFHEVGHSVHSRSNAPQTPFLKCYDYVPGFFGFVEGVGTLFEEIPRSAAWLATRRGFDRRSAGRFSWIRNVASIAGAGRLVASVRTELELYRNPSADLDRVGYDWSRRLSAWDSFEPPPFVDPFYVFSPVYVPSYVLAVLFAKQLLETMLHELGGSTWPNPRFGPWLIENWFRESGRFDWAPQVARLTGRDLGPRAYNAWARGVISEP